MKSGDFRRSPDGIIPPSGTNTSRPAEHNVMGTRNKNFANGLRGIRVSGATLISTSWFVNPWLLVIGETTPYTEWWFRAYLAFWRTLSQPCKVLSLTSTVTKFSNGHPPFYQASHFRMVGNMVRPVNFLNMGSLLHFFGSEISSLIRSHTMMVDKAFCGSMDGGFGRALHTGR